MIRLPGPVKLDWAGPTRGQSRPSLVLHRAGCSHGPDCTVPAAYTESPSARRASTRAPGEAPITLSAAGSSDQCRPSAEDHNASRPSTVPAENMPSRPAVTRVMSDGPVVAGTTCGE